MADNTLKVHHLRPAPGAKTPKTRVGRGEASKGKTAGRGTKGTKARYQVPAAFEGGQMPLHMRLPKLKGFKNRFRTEYQVVNLDKIAERFPGGGTVGVEDLVSKGLAKGRMSAVGFSDTKPLIAPSDPRSVTMNRRVDVVVLTTLPADQAALLPAAAGSDAKLHTGQTTAQAEAIAKAAAAANGATTTSTTTSTTSSTTTTTTD